MEMETLQVLGPVKFTYSAANSGKGTPFQTKWKVNAATGVVC